MSRIDMALSNCPYAIPFEPEFASETSAMFRLGYDREFVFEDLNERMNARPTPPGFRRRRICGSCFGKCANPSCEAPWDRELDACSAGCDKTERTECMTCKSNAAVRKSVKWARRARAFLQGYEAHQGQAAFITFKLPMFALRPEHVAEFEAFKSDRKQSTNLFIEERLPVARENLERQLNRRREAGRPGLPVRGSDSYFQHRPLLFQEDEDEWVRRVNAGSISTEDAAFEEAFEDLARKRASEYVQERFDSLVQLHAFKQGWLHAVVESWRRYIPREVHKRGGFNYVCEGMLSNPVHFKATTERLPDDIKPERLLPHLQSHLVNLVEKRVKQDGINYQFIRVIEQGSQGGFHFHMLLCCLHGTDMDVVERRLRYHWHRIAGNVHWDQRVWHPPSNRYVTKSWFERFPVSDQQKLSHYISKYVSKGWIDTRVRGSVGLALSDVVRDMSLQKQGFVPDRDLTACWHPLYRTRRVRGSDKSELYQVGLTYQSPYAALLESAAEIGSDTWLLLEFEDSRLFNKSEYLPAPKVVGMVLTEGPVASMLSSEFAVGIDTECNELSLVQAGTVAIPIDNLWQVDDQNRRKFLASLVIADQKNQEEFDTPDQQAVFIYYYKQAIQKMESGWQRVHELVAPFVVSVHNRRHVLAARPPPH